MTASDIEEFKNEVHGLVEEAIDFGRKSPVPGPEVALEDVYVNL
jgi:TPP-dependent pyruvate/acetoin dehydrogenase alpha subunit